MNIEEYFQKTGWTAHGNEMRFIERMGQYSDVGRKVGRAGLLRKYLAACERRADWFGIQRDRVIQFACAELAKLEAV